MQGLITLDLGNTHPHAGFFQKAENQWTLVKTCPLNEIEIFMNQLDMNPANSSMVLASVKDQSEKLEELQHKGWQITAVKSYWRGNKFAGMPVNYQQTLGEDRLIQAFYLFKKLKKNALLIDAGSFLTIDVIDTETGFKGGYIAPGFKNYKDTFQNGEQLKEFEINSNLHGKLPNTTLEAMRESYQAFAYLSQGLVKNHHLENIYTTGGNSEIFNSCFENLGMSHLIINEPHLIHYSLQYWMTTQIELL